MATPIQMLQGTTVVRVNRQKSKDPRFPQRSGQSSKTVPQLRPCGCGPIGRAVASESNDPWFKTQHHNILIQDKDQIAGLLPLMVLGSSPRKLESLRIQNEMTIVFFPDLIWSCSSPNLRAKFFPNPPFSQIPPPPRRQHRLLLLGANLYLLVIVVCSSSGGGEMF